MLNINLGDEYMGLKNRLHEIRHDLRIDRQIDMAAMLGLLQQQYNRYERNQVQPTLEMAIRIAHKLNKQVEDVFYIEETGE